jgi:hypothetical protein
MSVFMMLQVEGAAGRLAEVMQESCVTSEPRITFWHPLDTPDKF